MISPRSWYDSYIMAAIFSVRAAFCSYPARISDCRFRIRSSLERPFAAGAASAGEDGIPGKNRSRAWLKLPVPAVPLPASSGKGRHSLPVSTGSIPSSARCISAWSSRYSRSASASPAGMVFSTPAFRQRYSAYLPPSNAPTASARTTSRSSFFRKLPNASLENVAGSAGGRRYTSPAMISLSRNR